MTTFIMVCDHDSWRASPWCLSIIVFCSLMMLTGVLLVAFAFVCLYSKVENVGSSSTSTAFSYRRIAHLLWPPFLHLLPQNIVVSCCIFQQLFATMLKWLLTFKCILEQKGFQHGSKKRPNQNQYLVAEACETQENTHGRMSKPVSRTCIYLE